MTDHAQTAAETGLRVLAGRYPILLCDIWGVVHNGMEAHPKAAYALLRFRDQGGTVALITNAPRPAASVEAQLASFGITRASYDVVVTSGDVTRDLVGVSGLDRIFHLGPDRDLALFKGLDVNRVTLDQAQAILCTGLIDDDVESPEDYRKLLGDLAQRNLPMYCANPDRVVQRGEDLVYCAGALADVYEQLGGDVIIAGKPHSPIYQQALNAIALVRGSDPDKGDILAIGDGIVTDVHGAASFGLDALFITGGIHAAEAHTGPADGTGLLDRLNQVPGLTLAAVAAELSW